MINSADMRPSRMKVARSIAGYSALALGVTVGGVLIGATVVAPVMQPVVTGDNARMATRLVKDFVGALPPANQIPLEVWAVFGVALAVLLAALAAWRLRRRTAVDTSAPFEMAKMTTAALPAKPVVGRTSKTPRAVLALAEAGTAPADIARRTGLPLDAVALCLAMSPIGARQLRPPTA